MSRLAHRSLVLTALSGSILVTLWLVGAGCRLGSKDCRDTLSCPAAQDAGDADAPEDLRCVPSPDQSVPSECGAFVSLAGDDDHTGTLDLPVATFARAMALAAATGRVYACAESFAEAVVIQHGFTIYGGLDCAAGWVRKPGAATKLTTGPGAIPLTVTKEAEGFRLRDFVITAADGEAPGASSIAVVIGAADAELARCDLAAGNGVDALGGASAPVGPASTGADGLPGKTECSNALVQGGQGPFNTCGSGSSKGGNGGFGGPAFGGFGAAGADDLGLGEGGVGDEGGSGWTCESNLFEGFGKQGEDGENGKPGAAGKALGELSIQGFVGARGEDGEDGQAGQGGGGGGGRAGMIACWPQDANAGASGGSGAAGGCGGRGGAGGLAGGSSIALVSLGAKLTLIDVTLFATNAGRGGYGGDAQPGGPGGAGAPGGDGMNHGCPGGDGGHGGDGGPGGGGRGGHSIGIAHLGTQLSIELGSITIGNRGDGGKSGGTEATHGAAGLAEKVVSFE